MNILAFDENTNAAETPLARGEALGRALSIRRPLSRAVQGTTATRQLWPVFSTHAVHSELCVLQTPEVYLPYPPLVDGKGYRLFDVYGPSTWIDYVRGLEAALAARLRRWNEGRAFLSAVKEAGDSSTRIRFKHVRHAALWSYEERPCEWSDILCHQPLWILFVVRGVWATEAHWGVSFDVVQIQKREPTWTMRPFFRRPASTPEPEAPRISGGSSLPEPYATMVKRGVPLPAVHHKMRLDGLDPAAFTNATETAPGTAPPVAAPTGPAALFAALRGGVALRAAPPKEERPPVPVDDKLPRISLDEILRIKARLGKRPTPK